MKKHIPNLFTCLNLFSGCIGCIMAFNGEYFWVVFFVLLGCIFDFFDGFLARLLNAPSSIGKELDSLADMITFGTVPALLLFRYISDHIDNSLPSFVADLLPYSAFLLTVFSALRLAKFNVDVRQTSSFIGLNTPANAIFWISLCYGLNKYIEPSNILIYVLLVLIVCFSLLMNAEFPMFSLKLKNLKFKGNEDQYILAVFAILSIVFLQITGLAATILFYILLAFIGFVKSKNEQKQASSR